MTPIVLVRNSKEEKVVDSLLDGVQAGTRGIVKGAFKRAVQAGRLVAHTGLIMKAIGWARTGPSQPFLALCAIGIVQGGSDTLGLVAGGGVAVGITLRVMHPNLFHWDGDTGIVRRLFLHDWHRLPVRFTPTPGDISPEFYTATNQQFLPAVGDASPAAQRYLAPVQDLTDYWATVARDSFQLLDDAGFFVGHQRKIQTQLIPSTVENCINSYGCKSVLKGYFDIVTPMTDQAVDQLPRLLDMAPYLFNARTVLLGYDVSLNVAAQMMDYSIICCG